MMSSGFMQSLVDLWQGLLYFLGLAQCERTIVFLGLDNAGKTTLLHKLKYGAIRSFVPTQRANNEEITIGKLTIKAWDLGGHDMVRKLWKDFYTKADAIVFLVDSTDYKRLEEAKQEFYQMINAKELSGIPVMVLVNKSDVSVSKFHA